MLSCGQTQTLKAIMTVPTTVLGVSFFFQILRNNYLHTKQLVLLQLSWQSMFEQKCKQSKYCSNLSIRKKCMHNSKPLKYHWRPRKGYLHLVHAFVMANTFIDLDPETIEAPFLWRNVGGKKPRHCRVRSRQDASPLQAEVGGTPQQRRPRRTCRAGPEGQQDGEH